MFGVRSAKKKLATITLDSEATRQLAYQAQLKLAVTAAYWRVAQAERQLQLIQAQSRLSEASEQAAKRRLEAGRIAEVEYSRVLIAHQQVLTQLAMAQAGLKEVRFQLARLWGNTQPVFISTAALTSNNIWPELDEAGLNVSILQDSPQQQLLQQQQKQAQARLVLAKAQSKPQPTVSLGINQTRIPSMQNDMDNRLTLGVSMPIPVFNRNQGIIQATQALSHISMDQQRYNVSLREQQIQAGLIRLNALSSQYQQLQPPEIKFITVGKQQGSREGDGSALQGTLYIKGACIYAKAVTNELYLMPV